MEKKINMKYNYRNENRYSHYWYYGDNNGNTICNNNHTNGNEPNGNDYKNNGNN